MEGLCLSGGGDHIAYEVGACLALAEVGIHPTAITGTSAGAILGAFLAQWRPEEFHVGAKAAVDELLNRITGPRNVRRYRFPPYVSALWENSIFVTDRLRKTLGELIDPQRLLDSGVELRITATNLEAMRTEIFDQHHQHIIDCIWASAAFPIFFQLVQIGGIGPLYTDGYLDTAPLSHLINLGVSRAYVVLTRDPSKPKPLSAQQLGTVPKVASRVAYGFVQETIANDVKRCSMYNELVLAGLRSKHRVVEAVTVKPSRHLSGSSLDFDPDVIQDEMRLGYEDVIAQKISRAYDDDGAT